jgi:6-phosphogluconolactonase (cycloisomerase 2 family)
MCRLIGRNSAKLIALNQIEPTEKGPVISRSITPGKWLAVANYGSGNVATIPVGVDDKIGAAVSFEQHEDAAGRGAAETSRPYRAFHAGHRYLIVANVGLDRV